MTTRVGMVGVSAGNGHPYSFSAIINGYSNEGMAASGWQVIHEYLGRRDASDFGVGDLRVTHAWTQDPGETARLCDACRIDHAVDDPLDLLGAVDALIIARDDADSHWSLAEPFLAAGLPVFVDKPLALDPADLDRFEPYLTSGLLMSCSGLRYCTELDEARGTLDSYGTLQVVHGVVVNSWDKYGIHLLDAVLGLVPRRIVAVTAHHAPHESFAIELEDGPLLLIDCMGPSHPLIRLDLFGSARASTHKISDNFTMFRRTLEKFAHLADTGQPVIPPELTLGAMRALMAGTESRREGRRIEVDELPV